MRRSNALLKSKSRNSRGINLFMPGIEGWLQADYLPNFTPPTDPGTVTNLEGVKELIREKQQESAGAAATAGLVEHDLMEWLTQNDLSAGLIPLHLVNTSSREASRKDIDIPPFQGIINPFLAKPKLDVFLNACGPIYGMDFLSAAASSKPGNEDPQPVVYAAIGTSSIAPNCAIASDVSIMTNQPGAPKLHVRGKAISEPNLLQLWSLPKPSTPSSSSSIHMTYAIGHHFGAVWDLTWASPQLIQNTPASKGKLK